MRTSSLLIYLPVLTADKVVQNLLKSNRVPEQQIAVASDRSVAIYRRSSEINRTTFSGNEPPCILLYQTKDFSERKLMLVEFELPRLYLGHIQDIADQC